MLAYPCNVHSSEETRFYCNKCQRRICDDCVLEECKGHPLERARKEVDIKRSTIKQKLEAMNREKCQTVEGFRAKMTSVEEDIEKVHKRAEELKHTLDEICQKTLEELTRSKEEMEKHLKEMESDIQEKERFVVESLKKLDSMNEDEIEKVNARMKVLENVDLLFLKLPPPTFVGPDGKDDTVLMKTVFGYVQSGRHEEALLPMEQNDYMPMSPKSSELPKRPQKIDRYEEVELPSKDDTYLLMNPRTPEVQKAPPGTQHSLKAKVVITYDLGMLPYFFISKNDEFFVTDKTKLFKIKPEKEKQLKELVDANDTIRGIVGSNENLILMTSSMVYKFEMKGAKTKQCRLSNFVDPLGLFVACIGKAVSGNSLLLGLKITGDEAFELRRYPMEEKGCVAFEKLVLPREIQIPLITHVAESTNGDICAIVKDEADSSYLICFDSDGIIRYRYPKDEKRKRKFLGIGMLREGVIVLADACALSGIHFLDKDGCQLYFERRGRGGPLPISLVTDSSDVVWVGFDDGTVEEIKVTREFSFS
ncbi:uncharacterized protein LOC134263291 [Saccostrea cucullata]|uniref:uncharacterized protein LOC134263291 n=1 Tax=Saccostrea cuccullata TaxID=36930 RepID=UPI002ED57E22